MAKLLQKGHQSWNKTLECTGKGWSNSNIPCHSTWEVTPNDLKYTVRTLMDDSKDVYYYFICSICGCKTDISGIPDEIKAGIQKGPNTG